MHCWFLRFPFSGLIMDNKQSILIVEDDKKLSSLVSEYLVKSGFAVACEKRGDKAVYRIIHENYALVILDINLPEINGFLVCKLVRAHYLGFILMLTAREANEDQVTGLEWGADDYVNKPIQPKVLLARINALLRRKERCSPAVNILNFGQLQINIAKRIVILKNKIINLKPTEFDLLILLAMNAGNSLTRNNIMQALRGIDFDGIDRSIDLRISHLRDKLGDDPTAPSRILTIRNKGYVFQPDAWN